MKLYFTLIALICATLSLSAQPLEIVSPESVNLSSIHLRYADKAIEKAIENGYIPGAVLAVVKDGKMPYIKAFGNKSLKPNVEPMQINTIFDLASCTKPLSTALAAMILIERGELSLRDKLDIYIPNFNKKYNGAKCDIRVKHLMTHTTGFPSYVSVATLQKTSKELSINSIVRYIKDEPLIYETGTDFKYSCLNYIVLQYIIEQITKQSLQEFVKENIYDRLKMQDTDYLPLNWANVEDIAPTEVISADSVVRGVVHDPLAFHVNGGISGNSGLFSTASDVAILASTLLNEGSHNGKRLLSPITVDAMCRIPSDLSPYGRSLGWDVSSVYSSNLGDLYEDDSFGHTGFTGCSITLDRRSNMAVILLTNGLHSEKYESKEMIRLRTVVTNCIAASLNEYY